MKKRILFTPGIVGMLSTEPVEFEGKQIVPIQFLKALLPDPATLGKRTVGKTNIGCIFTGKKDGKEKSLYIYNVCDHQVLLIHRPSYFSITGSYSTNTGFSSTTQGSPHLFNASM